MGLICNLQKVSFREALTDVASRGGDPGPVAFATGSLLSSLPVEGGLAGWFVAGIDIALDLPSGWGRGLAVRAGVVTSD